MYGLPLNDLMDTELYLNFDLSTIFSRMHFYIALFYLYWMIIQPSVTCMIAKKKCYFAYHLIVSQEYFGQQKSSWKLIKHPEKVVTRYKLP